MWPFACRLFRPAMCTETPRNGLEGERGRSRTVEKSQESRPQKPDATIDCGAGIGRISFYGKTLAARMTERGSQFVQLACAPAA
jgi:hypothetical protein